MGKISIVTRNIIRKGMVKEKAFDQKAYAVSRRLWPWQESRLLALVVALVILDFCSTYAFIELSGNTKVYESGLLARWALQMGGFTRLFLVDLIATSSLLLAAIAVRIIYSRWGFSGYGRVAFVILLVPYVVVTIAAIFNNVALTFVQ